MRAGALRHRILIQRKIVTRDSFGAEVIEWQPVTAAWARVETPTGAEFVELAKTQATLTHKVSLRHRDGILPEMRVEWGNHTLEIEAVLADNRKREMMLACSEIVG